MVINEDIWSIVASYGGSMSKADQVTLLKLKSIEYPFISYLILSKQVLFGDRRITSEGADLVSPCGNQKNSKNKLSNPLSWIFALSSAKLEKTIQHFHITHCLVASGHTCNTSAENNEDFNKKDEEVYDPEFLIYYLLSVLRYHISDTQLEQKFIRAFVSHKCFAVLIISLSSECPSMREGALQVLDLFSRRLFLISNPLLDSFKEIDMVRWLCHLMQSLFYMSDRKLMNNTQLPPIVARIFAEYASMVIPNSQTPIALYTDVMKYVLSYPVLASDDLPIFTTFWFSTCNDNAALHRTFILRLLSQGLKNSLDFQVLKKRHIIEHLFAHLATISSASQLPDMILILEHNQNSELIADLVFGHYSLLSNLFIFFTWQVGQICTDKNELVLRSKEILRTILNALQNYFSNKLVSGKPPIGECSSIGPDYMMRSEYVLFRKLYSSLMDSIN